MGVLDQRRNAMKAISSHQRGTRVCTILPVAVLLSACATISTGSHYDETTDFRAYESFSWIDDKPLIASSDSIAVSALAQSKIAAEIQRQLEQAGYSFVDDRDVADFVVGFTVGTRDEIRIDSYPSYYRGHWGWHVPYSYYDFHEVSAHSYTKGTLGVDIFDTKSAKPVWHGWAEKTVTSSDRRNPDPSIEAGVAKLFESFPD